LQIYSEDGIIKGLNIVINTFEADSDRTIFQHEYKPHVIIMMDPNNQMLREIMLERQNGTLKEVHAIFFQGSIESQIFYKDKLDEDQAFEQLIQECSKLPQFDETPKDMIEEFQPVAQASTRVGRGAEFFKQVSESSTKPYIIVDFREFRSELPAQLFYKGFNIVPMMLKTGDYVLSNQVIIERKCVETGDLVESILGRRLDEQLKRMSEYEYPFLLIEYSERIPFDL
jgi:DNA excision repair protein ERCC-4